MKPNPIEEKQVQSWNGFYVGEKIILQRCVDSRFNGLLGEIVFMLPLVSRVDVHLDKRPKGWLAGNITVGIDNLKKLPTITEEERRNTMESLAHTLEIADEL